MLLDFARQQRASKPTMAVLSACPMLRCFLGFICYSASLAALGASIPIFFEGFPSLQLATVLRFYKEEFEPFDGECQVHYVTTCWHSTPDANPPNTLRADRDENGQPACWKSFVSTFSVPTGVPTARYADYPEYSFQGEGACSSEACESTQHTGGHAETPLGFATGSSYPCWRPNQTTTSTGTDSRYQCGNGPCYKLVDPASIVEPAIDEATRTITLGSALALAGLIIGCLSLCVWPPSGLAKKEDDTPPVIVKEDVSRGRKWTESPKKKKTATSIELKKPLSPKKKKTSSRAQDDFDAV